MTSSDLIYKDLVKIQEQLHRLEERVSKIESALRIPDADLQSAPSKKIEKPLEPLGAHKPVGDLPHKNVKR